MTKEATADQQPSQPVAVLSSEELGPRCRSETGDVMLCANAACGWLGRCVTAEPMEPGEERDCQHGQLARACDRCADAREIAELRAALLDARDCRTCRNFTTRSGGCVSVLRCVDGSGYKRQGRFQYWEAAPVEPAPF